MKNHKSQSSMVGMLVCIFSSVCVCECACVHMHRREKGGGGRGEGKGEGRERERKDIFNGYCKMFEKMNKSFLFHKMKFISLPPCWKKFFKYI